MIPYNFYGYDDVIQNDWWNLDKPCGTMSIKKNEDEIRMDKFPSRTLTQMASKLATLAALVTWD